MRRRCIREDDIVGDVVAINPREIEVRRDLCWVRSTSGAQGNQTDVDHIVAKAATIRPAAGDNAPVLERILRRALQYVTAKYARRLNPGVPARRAGSVVRSTLIMSGM